MGVCELGHIQPTRLRLFYHRYHLLGDTLQFKSSRLPGRAAFATSGSASTARDAGTGMTTGSGFFRRQRARRAGNTGNEDLGEGTTGIGSSASL